MISNDQPDRFTIDETCFISSESGIIMAHMKDASFVDAYLAFTAPGLVPDEFELVDADMAGRVRCRVIDRERGGMHVAFILPQADAA
jgi:hypothetical protein